MHLTSDYWFGFDGLHLRNTATASTEFILDAVRLQDKMHLEKQPATFAISTTIFIADDADIGLHSPAAASFLQPMATNEIR